MPQMRLDLVCEEARDETCQLSESEVPTAGLGQAKEAQMKLPITAIAIVLACSTGVRAQVTTINPNGLGGYNIMRPGQPPAFINPNGLGGYNIWTPGQPLTNIQPNGLGGYNIFSPPQPAPPIQVPQPVFPMPGEEQ